MTEKHETEQFDEDYFEEPEPTVEEEVITPDEETTSTRFRANRYRLTD